MGHLLAKLYRKQETRILMNGLDAAGKTTILYFLKLGEVVTSIPTIGFNVETVSHRNISLTTWDIGGRDKIRPLYRHYYPNTQAVMFVIDSADRDRLEIVADEIMKLLSEDELRDVVILVLANKQDLESAMSLDEIKKGLNYDKIIKDHSYRKINIFGCSAVTKEGQYDLYKALDWLCEELAPSKSNWWFRKSDKSPADKTSDKTNINTESNTVLKDGDSTDINSEKTEKNTWTLSCYMKESLESVKRVVTSLW